MTHVPFRSHHHLHTGSDSVSPELVQSCWSYHINPAYTLISFVSRSSFGVAAAEPRPASRDGLVSYSPALCHMYNVSVSTISATYAPLMKSDGSFS